MFSGAVGREGQCRKISLACAVTRSVPTTLGLPQLTACVLSPSTLLRLQSALQRVCPELCSLPRPKPLRFRFSGTAQRPRLGWAYVLCLPRLSSSDNQELEERTLPGYSVPYFLRSPALLSGRTSQVHIVSLLGS